jgi:hypothetical protein
MPTRLVVLFNKQELAVSAALIKGDRAALDRLVAEDFELRAGSRMDTAIPRDAWLANSLSPPQYITPLSPQQMAVWDFGNNAVVSFKWTNIGMTGQSSVQNQFVVDVWKRDGDNWKLAIHFIDPVGPIEAPVPGLNPKEPIIPKKY